MDAVESQIQEATALMKILVGMFSLETFPIIEMSYTEPTGYNPDNDIIRIKMPFSLSDVKSIKNIPHECYHYVEFTLKNFKKTYSSEDRKIIETKCSEYAYKYKFERDASIFMFLFTNYFFNEVVGYNYKEVLPSISAFAKNLYPELEIHEGEMILDYIERKATYYKLFEQYKQELLRCYETFY